MAALLGGRPPGAQRRRRADTARRRSRSLRVVEQPVNVMLSLPGQLDPYEMVAMYPKVTGFVKTISVDRGSRVRTGEVLAVLEAPELSAQRAEAQSKLQAASAQLAATRAKADADTSTYDRLKAASATPGAVAGNDVVVAQKAVEADRSQIAAAEQNAEAARQALQSVTEMEGYLKSRRAVRRRRDGAQRPSRGARRSGRRPGRDADAAVQKNDRLRLVVPVPEAYTADVTRGAV